MKTKIFIVEARSDCTTEAATIIADADSMESAITHVASMGYRVMLDDDGGCCEWHPKGLTEDDHEPQAIVTVYPDITAQPKNH